MERIELSIHACKAHVFPLALHPQIILKHTRTGLEPVLSGDRLSISPPNVLQYKLVQAPRFELETGELKVRCDTISPYLDCFSFFLIALLLFTWAPALRNFTNATSGFLFLGGAISFRLFIYFSFKLKKWSVWMDSNHRPLSSKPSRLTRLTLHTDCLAPQV